MTTIWNSPCKVIYQTFHNTASGNKVVNDKTELFINYHAALKWFWKATKTNDPPLNADFYINEKWAKNIKAM